MARRPQKHLRQLGTTFGKNAPSRVVAAVGNERRPVLIDGLRELRPDVVAFQEAIVGDGYDQVVGLLGPDYHVVHQTVGLLVDGNYAASIASRWPLGEVREVDLHVTLRTEDYPCAAIAAEVLGPGPVGPPLFVAHGPSYQWGAELELELQAVAAAPTLALQAPSSPSIQASRYYADQ